MNRTEMRKRGLRRGFFAFGAHKELADDSTLEVNSEKVRIKDSGVSTAKLADEGVTKDKLYQGADVNIITATGVAATSMPNMLTGLTENTATFADTDNDDVALGQVCVASGNVVEGIIGDIGTATAYRITAVVNRSGGVLLVTVADESNTLINGQGKRLSIVDKGFCVLMETGNDTFVMLAASGVSLVAFA